MTRECLHYGFDALYVAFQGSLSRSALREMKDAKARAKKAGKPIYAVISGMEGHIGDTGAKGGYQYRFDQGQIGAKWLVKDNDNPTEWNLFCEVPAIALIEYGIEECLENIRADLKQFDARIVKNSVNRFDVAVDIMDDNFVLNPAHISVHSHTKIKQYGDDDEADNRKSLIVGGNRIETVTIGSMPNRQATIYDKRKQVVYSQKSHMWKFWGREKSETNSVWRVELRFGKKYLKKTGIETIEDMLARGGDLIAKAFEDIQYLDCENHKTVNATRAKMADFWSFARDFLMRFGREAMPNGKMTNVREVIREDHQRFCHRQIIGFFKNIAATRLGLPDFPDREDAAAVSNFIGDLTRQSFDQMNNIASEGWGEFEKGVNRVRKKYHYIERGVA